MRNFVYKNKINIAAGSVIVFGITTAAVSAAFNGIIAESLILSGVSIIALSSTALSSTAFCFVACYKAAYEEMYDLITVSQKNNDLYDEELPDVSPNLTSESAKKAPLATLFASKLKQLNQGVIFTSVAIVSAGLLGYGACHVGLGHLLSMTDLAFSEISGIKAGIAITISLAVGFGMSKLASKSSYDGTHSFFKTEEWLTVSVASALVGCFVGPSIVEAMGMSTLGIPTEIMIGIATAGVITCVAALLHQIQSKKEKII